MKFQQEVPETGGLQNVRKTLCKLTPYDTKKTKKKKVFGRKSVTRSFVS